MAYPTYPVANVALESQGTVYIVCQSNPAVLVTVEFLQPSINLFISGLLYRSDGTLTGWTGDAAWTSQSQLTFPCYPIGTVLWESSGPQDQYGVRQNAIYTEGNTWYGYYDAGNGTYWVPQYKQSANRGFNWSYVGNLGGLGLQKTIGGNYPTIAHGWFGKWGDTYYFERTPCGNATPGPGPYGGLSEAPLFWDRWIGSSINNMTTPDPNVPGTGYYDLGTSGDTKDGFLAGSIVLVAGIYYALTEGINLTAGSITIGVSSSVNPDGPPWTGNAQTTFATNAVTAFGSRYPENPKGFVAFGSAIILVNMVASNTFFTDSSAVGVAASFSSSDLQAATWRLNQRICPMDGANAIGVPCHITGPNGVLIAGANSEVPITYDSDGNYTYPGWHAGRLCRHGVLEPSQNCLQNLSPTDPIWRQISRPVSNTDCVIEAVVCFLADTNANFRLMYRSTSNGISGTCYAILFNGRPFGLVPSSPQVLEKWVSGVKTVIATSTGSLGYQLYFLHRLKITVKGNLHQFYLDGELQWQYTDTSSPITSGGYVGIGSSMASVQVPYMDVRASDLVTITGLLPHQNINLRSYGALPIAQTTADGNGTATFTWNHWPHSQLEVLPGVDVFAVNSRFWGGDTYVYSYAGVGATIGSTPTTPTVTSASVSVDGFTLTVNFSQAVLGRYGMTLVSGSNTIPLSYISGQWSATYQYSLLTPAPSGGTVTLNYTPGDIIGLNAAALAGFTGQAITNNASYTTLILDQGERTNGTPINGLAPLPINTPGHTWTDASNVFQYENGAISSVSTSLGFAPISTGVSDCVMNCVFNGPYTSSANLLFRYVDNNNCWLVNVLVANGTFIVYRNVSGSFTPVFTSNVFGPQSSHAVRVTLSGPNITVNWDGTNVFTTSDNTFQNATLHGIANAGATGQTFSDFQVMT